jgi:hypothetical protein
VRRRMPRHEVAFPFSFHWPYGSDVQETSTFSRLQA